MRQNGGTMKIAIRIFLIITYVYSGILALEGLSYLLAGETLLGVTNLASSLIAVPVTIIAHV